jgi:hypothetical protein
MKNLICFLAAFIASPVVYSQVSIGVKGGVQSSGINGKYNAHGYEITQIKSSRHSRYGIDLAFTFSEKFAFCTGLDYSVQGFGYQNETNESGVAFSGTNTIKYFEMPLTLKMKLLKSQLLYFRSGFYLSFILSAHNKGSIAYIYPEQTINEYSDEKIMDEMNKSAIGFLAATGLEVPLTKKLHLLTEVAYRTDLTPAMTDQFPYYIWKSTIDYYSTRSNVRNRIASLTLGITYSFD